MIPHWVNTPEKLTAVATALSTIALSAGYLIPLVYGFFRRPVLQIRFGAGAPWSRITRITTDDPTVVVFGLFVRVYVFNNGRSTARLVKGRFEIFVDRHGNVDPSTDPYDLHWVGTHFAALPEGITLLAKQGEFLDLFYVPTPNPDLIASAPALCFYPQDTVQPRGMPPHAPFSGQRMTVRVAAENAGAVGIEIQLPDGGVLGPATTDGFPFRLLHQGDTPEDWQ